MELQEIDQAITSLKLILYDLKKQRGYLTSDINIEHLKLDAEIACGLPTNSLNSKTRKKEVVLARHSVLYYLKKNTSLSYADVGKYFNATNWIPDHVTIMCAVKKVQAAIDDPKFDKELYHTYKLIEKQINNGNIRSLDSGNEK